MKKKLMVFSAIALSNVMLFSCKGDNKPGVTETGLEIGFKDTSVSHYYGQKIEKDDLSVKVTYSDGSKKDLASDKFKAFEYDSTKGDYTEISFPYSLEYKSYDYGKKQIFIYTIDKKHVNSYKFDVNKLCYFNYGSGSKVYSTYYLLKNSFKFTNALDTSKLTGSTVTYKSSNPNYFVVNDSGVVTAVQDFDMDHPEKYKAVISGYINNLKVDEYIIDGYRYKDDFDSFSWGEDDIQCSKISTQRDQFVPADNGKLHLPGICGTAIAGEESNRIDAVAKNGFINCTGIKDIEFPNSILKIRDSAFEGCTGITSDKTINFTEDLYYIGANAFKGVVAQFSFEDPKNWVSVKMDGETPVFEEIDFSNKETAKKALTDETLCGRIYFKSK